MNLASVLQSNNYQQSGLIPVVDGICLPITLPLESHFFVRKFIQGISCSEIYVAQKINDYKFINQTPYSALVSTSKLNGFEDINELFELSSKLLDRSGLMIGHVETYVNRKNKILEKYPHLLSQLIYRFDALLYRVFPKLPITQKVYDFITGGKGKLMSRVELTGRLYAFGFEVVDYQDIDNMHFFVATKISNPIKQADPTYWPIVKLKRVGEGGREFKVYKLRTMYPYSEYLQDYVYQHNNLTEGGKFKDDFRVSAFGKLLRKVWLDEIPMIWNWLKGDLKLVGVRPLSQQYFRLYSEELKTKRTQTKPGLLPPFYADLPKTLDEIMASELKYLDAHAKSPMKTDMQYFFKIMKNILFKGARSG
ncbi:sugar transferase [Aquiflexum lacus]|uniref:sugar transferase n=1 Tax=Aquiflexum lacus TaxID=2483805 RepID=UPI00189454A7|nr:sugar transferase [Aquiflexum lacus]